MTKQYPPFVSSVGQEVHQEVSVGKKWHRRTAAASVAFIKSVGKQSKKIVFQCCGQSGVLADEPESVPLLPTIAASPISAPSSQVAVMDGAMLARKAVMEERAAACLARFTNAHVRLILDMWREVASVQRYQRLAISDMEDRRHQRTLADCLAGWQLQTAARRELRQLEAVAARQTRLYMMKRLFGAWVGAYQQQQAELAAAKQEMLQRRAARVLQHWKAAVDQQKAIQEKAAAKFATMQRHRLLEALVAWSLHCKSCKELQVATDALAARRHNHTKANTLTILHLHAAQQVTKRQDIHKADQLNRRRLLRAAVHSWSIFLEEAQEESHLLTHSLLALRHHAAKQASKRRHLHTAHQLNRRHLLQDAVICWKSSLQAAKMQKGTTMQAQHSPDTAVGADEFLKAFHFETTPSTMQPSYDAASSSAAILEAELYASMQHSVRQQDEFDSVRGGWGITAARSLLRSTSSSSSGTFGSNSGQEAFGGAKTQYAMAAKTAMLKLSASMQSKADAAAEAFADGGFAEKLAQGKQDLLRRATASDVAAAADRLAGQGQDMLRRAAASDAAAKASAKAGKVAARALEGAGSLSAVAQRWTAKGVAWGNTVSWFD